MRFIANPEVLGLWLSSFGRIENVDYRKYLYFLNVCVCLVERMEKGRIKSKGQRFFYHYSKFQALKRIKRKEKFGLLGSYALQAKPDLGKNGKLLKKVFDVLTSLSMCIFGSHFSNLHLTSHETLIPNNRSVWMRKDSYGWAFALLVLDLILSIFVGPFMHCMSYLHAFYASCISLYASFLFWSYFYLLVLCE